MEPGLLALFHWRDWIVAWGVFWGFSFYARRMSVPSRDDLMIYHWWFLLIQVVTANLDRLGEPSALTMKEIQDRLPK